MLEERVKAITDAEDEKNREGNGVVIRADLAEDLKLWLADKLASIQAEARRQGEPIPARLARRYPDLQRADRPDPHLRPRPESRRAFPSETSGAALSTCMHSGRRSAPS